MTGVYGVGARLDVPLTARVDIDGRLTWFVSRALPEQGQGGQTLQGGVGVRGRFITKGRASFYGGLWPEFLHFSRAAVGATDSDPVSTAVVHGLTEFALDMGLGAEVAVGSGWAVRGELTGPVYAADGYELGQSPPNAQGAEYVAVLGPRLASPWQFSAGASYRFNALASDDEQPVAGRCETGGAVSRLTTTDALALQLFNLAGIGGFGSCRVAPAVYADAAVEFFPRDVDLHTPFSGGRLVQALAGAKLGTRKNRYGFFGKIRVGANRHSAAVTQSGDFDRYTATAVDVGGVLERYFGRRWFMRFDGGDVVSVFHRFDVNLDGTLLHVTAPRPTSSIQLAILAGWRF